MTTLVLPDGFVGLLRGRDPPFGIAERDSRLLEVGGTAERLGGELRLESNPGAGTEVEVTVPLP